MKTETRDRRPLHCARSVFSFRCLRQLLDELSGEFIEGVIVWPLKHPALASCLEICAVLVDPEGDVPILDAAGYVGLRYAAQSPIRDAPPHLRKPGAETLLAFRLKLCQFALHITERIS
jgi:hypothetical protein